MRTSRLILLCTIAIVLSASSGIAEVPVVQGHSNEFLVQRWMTENGLPQNTVTSLVQTRDGYIWVGTFGGLARFDGISFTIFDAANSPTLKSNRVLSLFEDSHGTLWIGAETGEIYYLKDFSFRELVVPTEKKRNAVWAFEEDAEGGLFFVSDLGVEKIRLDENGEMIPGSRIVLSTVQSSRLSKDATGKIWAKVGVELFAIEDDKLIPARELGMQFPELVLKMEFAPDGRAFVACVHTLGMVGPNTYEEFLPLKYPTHRSNFSLNAHGDALWFQQASDLYKIDDDRVIRYDLSKYIEGGSRVQLFDSEGNLWIGTNYNGLVRLTRRDIGLLSDQIGRSLDGVYSLAQDADGVVWIAAGEQGLFRLLNGDLRKVGPRNGLGNYPTVRSVAVDANNTIWIGGTLDVHYVKDDQPVRIPAVARKHVHALFFDEQHRLWVGSNSGVGVLADGEYTHYTTADGLANNGVHFITQTRDRAIWLGTTGGISIFRDGKFENLTTANGLSADFVRDIVEDDDGTMWFATYGGGITRYRNGQMSIIRRIEGLPNNFVSRILVDDDSRFWIVTNVGIAVVDRNALNDVADGRVAVLAGLRYDTSDGMPSSEANGGHQPAGIKTRDGRLWVPMLQDIVIIDPKQKELSSPKIAIEQALSRSGSDHEKVRSPLFNRSEPLRIQDGFRNLEISYTGLNFKNPDDLRFFYRLTGFDENWVDAGSRRTAFFPYLPAGSYVFEVKALSPNGRWSDAPATLEVIVAQHFWETTWFITVMTLFTIGIAAFFYRSRMLIRKEREARGQEFSRRLMHAQEGERERIAGELHDGLGQNLLLIKNWAALAVSDNGASAEVGDYLSKISDAAADSLTEARAIVQNLSPQVLRRFGLTEAVVNNVDHVRDATGVVIETDIQNIDDIFPPETEIFVYRIIQECLNNIVRHSESPRGMLDIKRSANFVTIVIEDFGKGFDRYQVLSESGNSGIGLHSIAQRVEYIGGKLSIKTRPGEGTRVTVKIKVNDARKDNKDIDR